MTFITSFVECQKGLSRRQFFLNNWVIVEFLAPLVKLRKFFTSEQFQSKCFLYRREPKSYDHGSNVNKANILPTKEFVLELILKKLKSLFCFLNTLLTFFLIKRETSFPCTIGALVSQIKVIIRSKKKKCYAH